MELYEVRIVTWNRDVVKTNRMKMAKRQREIKRENGERLKMKWLESIYEAKRN